MALYQGIVNLGHHPEAQEKTYLLPSEGRGREFESRRVRQAESRGIARRTWHFSVYEGRPEGDGSGNRFPQFAPFGLEERGKAGGKCSPAVPARAAVGDRPVDRSFGRRPVEQVDEAPLAAPAGRPRQQWFDPSP